MSTKLEYGCKKCGGVVKLEMRISSSGVTVNVKENGDIREDHGRAVVRCRKCHNTAVAEVSVTQLQK